MMLSAEALSRETLLRAYCSGSTVNDGSALLHDMKTLEKWHLTWEPSITNLSHNSYGKSKIGTTSLKKVLLPCLLWQYMFKACIYTQTKAQAADLEPETSPAA